MRKLNSVKQLGKTSAHRKAMFSNMVISLINHERIITTKEKAKVLKRISEKLITRAKKNIAIEDKSSNNCLHNKRIIMKTIKDRDAVAKLFDDIAIRNKDRNGGYTRILLLGERRAGDAAEKAIVEFVEKKSTKVKTEKIKDDKSKKSEKTKSDKVKKSDKKIKDKKTDKADKKEKDKKEKKKSDKKS